MKVYLSDVEYYFFKLGALVVAFVEEPKIAKPKNVGFHSILITADEVSKHLGESRLLIQKKY